MLLLSSDTLDFFRRIYGANLDLDGTFTIIHIHKWDGDSSEGYEKRKRALVHTFKYPLNDLEHIDWDPHLEANKNGADIYFGSMLRSEEFLNKRGSSRGAITDCSISTCLSLDIDFASEGAHSSEELPGGIEDVAEIFDIGPLPSILVDSGHGVHAHWVYKTNITLSGSKQEAKEYGKRRKAAHKPYVQALKKRGWHCDATWTPDRVWRIPGFLNWKVPDNPVPVTVVFGLGDDFEKHDIDEMPAATGGFSASQTVAKPSQEGEEGDEEETDLNWVSGRVKKLSRRFKELFMPRSIVNLPAALYGLAESDEQHGDPDRRDRAKLIWRLLAGKSICAKGKRDHALTRMCGVISLETRDLGRQFQEDELSCIVEDLMGPSLQAWVADSEGDTDLEREYEKAVEKLTRLKDKDVEAMDAGLGRLAECFSRKKRRRYSDAFNDVDEDEDEEDEEDPSRKELLKKGVIIHQGDRYIYDWVNHRYFMTPARDPLYFTGVKDICWPETSDCPFQHAFVTEKGERKTLTGPQICAKYGSSAEKVLYSFDVQGTSFNNVDRTFTINPAPRRYSEPEYNEGIDYWLKLLGGNEHYESLCDWLASLCHLDKPCAALYLNGPPGCGKSLFALGATQLWSEGSVMYEGVATVFNEDLLKSPVCLVDEGFTGSGHNDSMTMRRLVAQQIHRVNKKGGAIIPLHTYLRIIIAANNSSVLFTGKAEKLSTDDARAMSERILYVKVPNEEAREFFEEHNEDNLLTKEWIEGGAFARHVLWLGEQRDLSGKGRFLVEGKSSDMHSKMLFQGEERSKVFEAMIRFAMSPNSVYRANVPDKEARNGMLLGDGILAINAGALSAFWSMLLKSGGTGHREEEPARHQHLQSHLKAISGRAASIRLRVKKDGISSNHRYWIVPIELILLYVETYDFGDAERIEELVYEENKFTRKLLRKVE